MAVRDRLKGHAITALISLGRRLKSLDLMKNGLIGKVELRECLMEELSLSQQVQANARKITLTLAVRKQPVLINITKDNNMHIMHAVNVISMPGL